MGVQGPGLPRWPGPPGPKLLPKLDRRETSRGAGVRLQAGKPFLTCFYRSTQGLCTNVPQLRLGLLRSSDGMGAGRCPLGTGTLTHMGAAFSGPHTHVYSTGLRHALVFSALRVPAGPGHTTVGAWSSQAEAPPCWWENQGSPSRREIKATEASRLSQEPKAGWALEST